MDVAQWADWGLQGTGPRTVCPSHEVSVWAPAPPAGVVFPLGPRLPSLFPALLLSAPGLLLFLCLCPLISSAETDLFWFGFGCSGVSAHLIVQVPIWLNHTQSFVWTEQRWMPAYHLEVFYFIQLFIVNSLTSAYKHPQLSEKLWIWKNLIKKNISVDFTSITPAPRPGPHLPSPQVSPSAPRPCPPSPPWTPVPGLSLHSPRLPSSLALCSV